MSRTKKSESATVTGNPDAATFSVTVTGEAQGSTTPIETLAEVVKGLAERLGQAEKDIRELKGL